MQTRMKAKSVPMLVRSTISSSEKKLEVTATARPVTKVVTWGVRKRGCTLAKDWGSSPSRAMAKKMRGCPYWKTSNTADIENTAPSATILAMDVIPVAFSAYASGSAAFPRSLDGTIPVNTAPMMM